MPVFFHVGAEACRPTIQMDEANKTGFDEGVQAIIDRRHRNIGHRLFGANEDFLRSWMIAVLQEDFIDVLAMGRETEAAIQQLLIKMSVRRRGVRVHAQGLYRTTILCQ
jgi:hypothetical protein